MGKAKRSLVLLLTLSLVFSLLINPAFAITESEQIYDPYKNQDIETVLFDGVPYTYYYSYENGNRVMIVENDQSGYSDELVYDTLTKIIYLNGDQISFAVTENSSLTSVTASDWVDVSEDSYYITWAAGSSTAVVAGAIALYLGSLGPYGVAAAMGPAALAAIASSSIGGTLDVAFSYFMVPFAPTQYRYIWSFTPSTNEKTYGPFYYHFTN